MKIHDWSVVRTPDKKGVAIKPMVAHADDYEVCVGVRNGMLEVHVHVDGVDDPVGIIKLATTKENAYTFIPEGLKFVPPRSLNIAKKLKGE